MPSILRIGCPACTAVARSENSIACSISRAWNIVQSFNDSAVGPSPTCAIRAFAVPVVAWELRKICVILESSSIPRTRGAGRTEPSPNDDPADARISPADIACAPVEPKARRTVTMLPITDRTRSCSQVRWLISTICSRIVELSATCTCAEVPAVPAATGLVSVAEGCKKRLLNHVCIVLGKSAAFGSREVIPNSGNSLAGIFSNIVLANDGTIWLGDTLLLLKIPYVDMSVPY